MKRIVAILILFMLLGISQAQTADWREHEDGWEINCAVINGIYEEFGNKSLLRENPLKRRTVKNVLREIFTACNAAQPRTATASSRTSTPTPSLSVSTIRSLVSRHTKDIRILDLEIANNTIAIEYDLKPWPFVPNESIAEEVAFKIICALRKGERINKTLKFIGQGRFKTDLGRKFKSPSVEIHISARTANGLVCQGNSKSDINWRRVASRYKSYPIPRDASVDYD